MRTGSWLAATVLAAGGLMGVSPVAMADVLGANTTGAIDGSYVVVLKGQRPAGDRAARYSGTVVHTFSHVFHGFSVRMNERDARRIAADPAVSYVQQNQRIQIGRAHV